VTYTIYVENSVGRAIERTINLFTPKHQVSAVFQADIHPQMQRAQNGDEWWIRDVARRKMTILTQDRAILDDADERQAVVDSSALIIALGSAKYDTWQKLRCIVNHWDAIEMLLATPGPAAITIWLSRIDLEAF
jgi:hypothetical protein